jgi:hypothetical protein
VEQVIDKPHAPSFCKPGCTHTLSISRGFGKMNGKSRGFKPTGPHGRNLKGKIKLCAVVLVTDPVAERRNGHIEYLTACGEVVGWSSVWHRAPTCTKCRQALRAAGATVALGW